MCRWPVRAPERRPCCWRKCALSSPSKFYAGCRRKLTPPKPYAANRTVNAMARLRPVQLDANLRKGLTPIYWVSGVEPLLVQDARYTLRHEEQGACRSIRAITNPYINLVQPKLRSTNRIQCIAVHTV